MELLLHEFELPLRHTFTISRKSISVQPTLIVELRQDGHRGFGEATANTYYNVTLDSLKAALEPLRDRLAKKEPSDPETLWAEFTQELRGQPFAQCALDEAIHDLWGKTEGQPVYRLWGLSTDTIPASNFTIGIDTIDVMIAKMQEMPGWPVYKIKLGTEHDVEIVKALREHTEAKFRVDANCGWTVDETLRNAEQLAALGVEFIEQPLPAEQVSEMNTLYERCPLPLAADESCLVESDVVSCLHRFHIINIKLMKCGGLTPARRMIAHARKLGMQVMVGCMTESTVGISAIAQLLPLLDYVDMDGAALLARDIACGVRVDRGICHFPSVNGCGVELL